MLVYQKHDLPLRGSGNSEEPVKLARVGPGIDVVGAAPGSDWESCDDVRGISVSSSSALLPSWALRSSTSLRVLCCSCCVLGGRLIGLGLEIGNG